MYDVPSEELPSLELLHRRLVLIAIAAMEGDADCACSTEEAVTLPTWVRILN